MSPSGTRHRLRNLQTPVAPYPVGRYVGSVLSVDDDADLDDADLGDADLDDADTVVFDVEPISDPIGTARRRHGAAGAILAAGMFGVDIALGRKPKEEAPIVVAANSEPIDIEKDGIEVEIDETTSVYAPPQPPSDPFPRRRRRKA